ncbi:MAG: type II toxin-antitoxin system VapC family toxin [Gemmatimonadales bacterium]|nr:type II toxin-antitoxin system VapC family toxin [Gemmatimonadales bacterium]MYG48459.1 type II toxin-antitoxin system VapC family toxin [Gemmatimonadales bacterium]MYK00662.1 type II toxin-antitoxin system VapC family toxin [Candidatus Palauibacter ramosifaciens]
MSGVLLDTNVISELTEAVPAPPVVAFLSARDDLWLSALVLHELGFGLRLLPRGSRRDALNGVLSEFIRRYEDRVLPVDERAAVWAARFRAEARGWGRPLDLGDALIAGTAKANDLSVATRNVTDFEGFDLVVTNPWEFP